MTEEDKAFWRTCWRAARRNMPVIRMRYGKTRTLRTLLGYATVKVDGSLLSCAEHYRTDVDRGSKPRCPNRRHLLKAFASNNGNTLAKAVAIQKGYDPK